MGIVRQIIGFSRLYLSPAKKRKLSRSIYNLTGVVPYNLAPYRMALIHSSAAITNNSGEKDTYERLEFLGDAILGAITANFLFKKYPFKDEGFLTEIRSRIVNRESLNQIGRKIGLDQLIIFNGKSTSFSHKSIYGDALEAMVGAVYLDKGYDECQHFVLKRILYPHFNLEELIQNTRNFKSLLLEWCQKQNRKLVFHIINESGDKFHKEFTAQVIINDEVIGTGKGFSKKKAEQAAAEDACTVLKIASN
ncbi:MAG: rnc [Chitinophagaceae bacterium]|nr:rnc [Chitinophagaceae bacterium]